MRSSSKSAGGQVANRPIYAAIGVSLDGHRDVLGLWAAPAVRAPISSMSVLTDIRHRGTRDVFFLVCDGLKGLPDEASQHESQSTQVRPTPTPVAPERELADLDTTKFHTHWSPEVDHQLMNSRTIPQHSSRPEGPRL
ncbi:hypothetical protein GCM10020255_015850 [Rhodococcus baikonurensis]